MQISSELQRYNSCTMWLESLRSKSTKKVYCIHLSLFCKFHNVTPDRLLELNNSVGQLKTMVLEYIIHLKNELQRYNSCTMWLESLRSRSTKKSIAFTFRYSANFIMLLLIVYLN